MLDPQAAAFLEAAYADPPPRLWELEPAQWRAQLDGVFTANGLAPADGVSQCDRRVDVGDRSLRLRIYRPPNHDGGAGPGLVYFHGGGMVANSLETYDALMSHLCADSGCTVIGVAYRLAPEHKFPAGVDDAYDGAAWVAKHAAELDLDPHRLAIGGDSAGGYLTAAVTQLLRDRGGPRFAFQLLIYPAVGTRGHSASMAEFATGYLFERAELDWIYATYLKDPTEARDPRACPIVAEDFSDLPPAYVMTAEYDPMRDDVEHYGELLRRAGVQVEIRRWKGQFHPFLNLGGAIDAGREAITECARKVREALTNEEQAESVLADNEFALVVAEAPNGSSGDSALRIEVPGGAVWRGDTLLVEGDGPAPTSQVRVQLRQAPEASSLGDRDAVIVDPGRYRVLFEDDSLRVVRLAFAPGEQGQMVSHPARVLATLTDVHVRVEMADGTRDERAAPAGVAAWLNAESLITENVGDLPLEVVLVEPKSAGS